MDVTKRRKHCDQFSTQSPSPSNKLFVDYPYPIIAELDKFYQQQKQSDHPYALTSLRWYKDRFHRIFGLLHDLHNHYPSISIKEQSFKQAHIDEHSSKAVVNNLQETSKPTRIKRVLPSSMSPPMNDQEKQNNERWVRKINKIDLDHQIVNDPG